jgi:hypothetical protein
LAFCSEFIGSLGKPYFIDPMTHIFANDPAQLKRFVKDKSTGRTLRDRFGTKKKGDIRRSYSKLVEVEYGGVVSEAVTHNRPLSPKDFGREPAIGAFVKQVVAFQRDRLAAIPEKYKKYEKYAQKTGRPLSTAGNPPMLLVPPYFATTTLDPRGWHSINLRMIQSTKADAHDIPVFAVVLADPTVLAQHARQIASDYVAAGVDGFLLWPDGFSGYEDSTALRVVFDTVQTLTGTGKHVIMMYGDAFSLVLRYAGLSGFSCGICYGERKLSTEDVDVEGGIPPRYYLRRLKKKVVIETEAKRISIDQYPDLRCNCQICQRKPDPATLDDQESREHFMLARADEITELRSGLSQRDFASALNQAYEQHEDDLLLQPIRHLRSWSALIAKGRKQ